MSILIVDDSRTHRLLMSPVNGMQACGRIAASGRVGDIPIVMVSALNDEVKLQAAFAAGAKRAGRNRVISA